MTVRTEVIRTCDICPEGKKTSKGVETHTITLDGQQYEYEACARHSTALEKIAAPYVGAGRRQSSAKVTVKTRSTAQRGHSAAIRVWAKDHGIKLSERGRIPADVVSQWEEREIPALAATG